MKWAGPTPMPHKGLAEVAPPGVFEVRPWASHALKSRGANVALPAMAAFALAGSGQQAGLERPCETLVAWARAEDLMRVGLARNITIMGGLIRDVLLGSRE
jgi:hypothetical protein